MLKMQSVYSKPVAARKKMLNRQNLNLKVANLEKQQLENEIKSKQQTMQVEMKEAEIAADIQENDLHELERKLNWQILLQPVQVLLHG